MAGNKINAKERNTYDVGFKQRIDSAEFAKQLFISN